MTKSKTPSEKEQRIAADILIRFMFTNTMEEVRKVWNEVYNDYNLCSNPFTSTPCSCGEYFKDKVEYEKQTMIEKYGYYDGLE